WINEDVQYALGWPKWEYNLGKAKMLMADAGYPNGFTVDWLTPAPPFYSRGERVISQLQAIGIRTRLQTLERSVFLKRRQGGLKEWPGVNIIFTGARIGASWANWYESEFKCGGMLAADEFCVKDLDAQYEKYLASVKPDERKVLAEQIQREILENYYFVPVFRHAFMNAIGPRIKATKWQDVFPSAISTGYPYPWEDIELKAGTASPVISISRSRASIRKSPKVWFGAKPEAHENRHELPLSAASSDSKHGDRSPRTTRRDRQAHALLAAPYRPRSSNFSPFPAGFRGNAGTISNRRQFVTGEPFAREFPEFGEIDHGAGFERCHGDNRLAPLLVRQADHRDLGDGRMVVQNALHLGRVNVLATRDHHVLQPVGDIKKAVLVEITYITGMKPTFGIDRRRRRFGVVPISSHDISPIAA